MRQLFWPFSITYRKFCVVAFVTPYKVHQIPFQKTFEQTKSTRRVLLFASAFSVPLLRPPRNLLVKNEWYIGATVTTRWPPHPALAFSRDRGRGPRRFERTFTFYSFLAEKVKFSKTVGQIPLKFCQPPWNFLR